MDLILFAYQPAVNMPVIPPPVNAVALLRGTQLAELARIPLLNRRVAAWLILLRDDNTCLWREREAPCTHCRGKWPCIDSNSRSHGAFGRCQNCHYNNLPCDDQSSQGDDGVTGGVSSNGSDSTVRRAAVVSRPGRSASAPGSTPCSHISEMTAANGCESRCRSQGRSHSTAESAESTVHYKPAAAPIYPAPACHTPTCGAPARTPTAHSLPLSNDVVVPRPPLIRPERYRAPAFGPLPVRPAPQGCEPYDWPKVRSILRKVRHRSDMYFSQGNPMLSLRLAPESTHVKVLSPRDEGGSWIVLVFNASIGVVYHGAESSEALHRATGVGGPGRWRTVCFPGLSGGDAGVYAATIAVWFLNKNPSRYPAHFTIDPHKAKIEHAMIVRGQRPEFAAMRTTAPTTLFAQRGRPDVKV